MVLSSIPSPTHLATRVRALRNLELLLSDFSLVPFCGRQPSRICFVSLVLAVRWHAPRCWWFFTIYFLVFSLSVVKHLREVPRVVSHNAIFFLFVFVENFVHIYNVL